METLKSNKSSACFLHHTQKFLVVNTVVEIGRFFGLGPRTNRLSLRIRKELFRQGFSE